MSLQVCHCCGWTKVTTHHGLRVHQGRMGCTPKGTRDAEPQQQYAWNHGGQTNINFSYKLDIQNTVKIDMSLQTCHCGWKKMTSYHGLRTHQGIMGCTAKGLRIPKEEQSAWRDHWKPQLDNKTLPVAKKVNTKEESTEEYWSAGSCNNHATAASRIKAEPVSPLEVCIPRYPEGRSTTSAERNQSSLHLKMNHWPGEIPAVEPEDMYRFFSELPSAPTEVPHGKKDSLLPTSGQETPRSQLLKEIHNCLEKYEKRRDEKTMNSAHERNESVSKCSTNQPPVPAKRKSLVLFTGTPEKAEGSSASANGEMKNDNKKEEPVSRAAPPVVPPKRKLRSFQVRQLSGRDFTNDLERANREMKVKELVRMFSVSAAQENAVGTEEKLGSEQPRRATDIKPEITPTAAEVPQKEAPSSLCEAANPDVPTNMTVKELAQMFSTQETAAGPKEKRGPGHRSSQVKLMAQRFLQPTSTDAAGQLKKKDHDSVPRPQRLSRDQELRGVSVYTHAGMV
ncbi:hypothetical protein CCH79_00019253 [Gambusia affinis]|uniref:Uncharacterized protein n=1 Tax=Gambusia affinis TaxID=33528 RepID=A0A315V8X3_GAMAF|nr:hypothetical protein CCH79_00019253 [Gambusia affinis]